MEGKEEEKSSVWFLLKWIKSIKQKIERNYLLTDFCAFSVVSLIYERFQNSSFLMKIGFSTPTQNMRVLISYIVYTYTLNIKS